MRNTASRAYLKSGDSMTRVVVTTAGQVFGATGVEVQPVGEVIRVALPYERWSDVPAAWLNGVQAWWK